MTRPWQLATWLMACLLLSGLAAACGAGGQDAPTQTNSSETVRSARTYREASIMQQQQYQQQQQQSAASEQAVADDSKPTPDPTQQAVADSGLINSGYRYGLPFTRNVIGDPEAPVLIVEYSDFQWPHCRSYAAQLEPQVIEEAVRSGLARYEYRHFIIFGAASQFAALATECAGDQGAWWWFKDAYMLQGLARYYTRTGALELARDAQLDIERFSQCIDHNEHAERLQQMQRQAIADGVTATPTFLVNGQPGARSLEALMRQVRDAAQAAEGGR